MPQNITIRKALFDDISALDLIKPVKEAGYFVRCLKEQDEGRRAIFMAALDGADVGYGMLNEKPRYQLFRRLGIPEIQDINVLPDARQKGVATALIAYCEGVARQRGCDQIGISVGLTKEYGPAQRLYVKQGYIPDGYGVTYNRESVSSGQIRPVDDDLCLMMVKGGA